MADDKKYYYLKLKENFFDSDAMIILEAMQDGYLYSNILLKLYLRSLKFEGKLMFNEKIPYNSTILAQVTRHKVGVIEKALKIFNDLDMIDLFENGAIYMSDIQNFIGLSSTEADRKRMYRAKIDEEKGQMSRQKSLKCPDKPTPEIEIEIEIEIDSAVAKCPYKEIVNIYNEICHDLPQVISLSDNRKKKVKTFWLWVQSLKLEKDSIEIIRQFFTDVSRSNFLLGKVKSFKANIDWLIIISNAEKVLSGNYKNNEAKQPINSYNSYNNEPSRGSNDFLGKSDYAKQKGEAYRLQKVAEWEAEEEAKKCQ